MEQHCGSKPYNFYPRPPRGGRPEGLVYDMFDRKFLSTPSARRATGSPVLGNLSFARFLSTPSARRATVHRTAARERIRISIHALREEGDQQLNGQIVMAELISIHALREEGDSTMTNPNVRFYISIHALREEGDENEFNPCDLKSYFYPRPPRGGRRRADCLCAVLLEISIHALREEGDALAVFLCKFSNFISIHALREEGDREAAFSAWTIKNFYPRPPRGGRPVYLNFTMKRGLFLSTPSARRATNFALLDYF